VISHMHNDDSACVCLGQNISETVRDRGLILGWGWAWFKFCANTI